ncbi:hypothetical protein BH09PAT2_BH09PAT2_09900 [soil metagenome]
MNRYTGKPRRFWLPQQVIVLWGGDGIFYANRKYQVAPRKNDILSAPPIPDWDDWINRLKQPLGTAYKKDMRYTLWISQNPYRFALLAKAHEPKKKNDYVLKSNEDLDAWLLDFGMHPGDLTSTGRTSIDAVIDAVTYPIVKLVEWPPLKWIAYKSAKNPVLDYGFAIWGGELE